jgi:hypothetical protein
VCALGHDRSVLWLWVLGGVAVWLVLGVLVAVTLGRGIRIANDESPHVGLPVGLNTADLPVALRAPVAVRAAARRRPLPLPPVGVGLIVVALALETAGFVARLTGARGALATAISMDAPFSVPRLYVAALFAVAALAAVAGAGVQEGRRSWWVGVALVAAAIASVKAGSTIHSSAMALATRTLGGTAALLISVTLAAGVLVGLWVLSRGDRRDRRRVLGSLGFYAVAVVGLSALSGAVAAVYGGDGRWAATATFVEESGEALAAVAYLVAVLVGVAPRLVLPAEWVLRRRADAESLEVAADGRGRTAATRGARS